MIAVWPFERQKKEINKIERQSYISVKDSTEEKEIDKIAKKLKDIINNTAGEIIILCIGSDRSTGDSLGPIVGTMLKEKNIPFPIYGTLEEPVHALNIKRILKEIHHTHNEPFILGIDACLGDESQIGMILLKEGPLVPGKALNKVLPSVGDYHLEVFVNYLDPFSAIQSLNTTRLYTVIKLAEIMTKIITCSTFNENFSSR